MATKINIINEFNDRTLDLGYESVYNANTTTDYNAVNT